jgi:hypothetical protein
MFQFRYYEALWHVSVEILLAPLACFSSELILKRVCFKNSAEFLVWKIGPLHSGIEYTERAVKSLPTQKKHRYMSISIHSMSRIRTCKLTVGDSQDSTGFGPR